MTRTPRRVRALERHLVEARATTALDNAELLLDPGSDPRILRSRAKGERTRARLAEAGRQSEADFAFHQRPEHRAGVRRRTHSAALAVGIPMLLGFGAWSTAGVHAYIATGASAASAIWWTGWLVEPLLMAIVVGAIMLRSRYRRGGTRLGAIALLLEVAALAASLYMNLTASNFDPAFAVGPLGAIATALLLNASDRAQASGRTERGSVAERLWRGVENKLHDRLDGLDPEGARLAEQSTGHPTAPTTATPTGTATTDPDPLGASDDSGWHIQRVRSILNRHSHDQEDQIAALSSAGVAALEDFLKEQPGGDSIAPGGIAVAESDPAGGGPDTTSPAPPGGGDGIGRDQRKDAPTEGAGIGPAGGAGIGVEPGAHHRARAAQGADTRERIAAFVATHEAGAGVQTREIARELGLARSTVREHRKRMRAEGYDV